MKTIVYLSETGGNLFWKCRFCAAVLRTRKGKSNILSYLSISYCFCATAFFILYGEFDLQVPIARVSMIGERLQAQDVVPIS